VLVVLPKPTLGGAPTIQQRGVRNMHTYYKSDLEEMKDTPWVVYCAAPNGGNSIKAFKHEIQAIAFTNYLNGGEQDIVLMKELLAQSQ
jgi:hypothetical protein